MQQNYLYNRLPVLGAFQGPRTALLLRLGGLPPFCAKFLLSETGWPHKFVLDLAYANFQTVSGSRLWRTVDF